ALLPPFFYQRELNVIVGDISSAESYLSLARLGDRLAAVAPSEDQKRRFRMYRRSVDHFVEAGAQRLGEWMTAELLLDGGKLELARQNFGVSGDEDEPLEEAAILIKAINGVGSGQLSSIDLNHWSEQLKVLRTEALESRNVRLLSAVDGLAKKTTDAGMEQLRTDVAADPLEVPVDRICSLVTASGQPDVLRGKIEALYVKELGKVLDDLSEPVAEDRLREFQSRCKQVELNSLGIVEAALNSRTVPGVDNKWIQRLESICAVFYHDAGSEEVTRFREIYQNTERAWRARLTRENPWPDENAWRQWLVDLDVYLQLFEKGELKVSPWGRTEMGQVIEDGSAYLKNRFEQEWENPEVKNWLADLEHWKDAMDNLREMDLLSDSHHDRILLDLCKASAEKIRVWAAGAVDGTSIKLRGAVAGYMDVPSVELAEAIVEAANHVAELADAQWPDEWLERWRQFIPAENPAEEEAGRVLLSTLGRQGPLYAKVSEEKRNAVNKIRSFDGNAWKSLRQRTGVLVALPLGYGGAYRGLSIEMQEAADEKLRQALKDALSKCEAVDFNNIPTPKLLATLSSGQTPDELQKSLESYRLWTEDKEDILEKYAQFVNALATWNTEQLEKSSAEFLRACPKGTDGSPEAAVKAVQAVEKAQNETLQAESMKKHQLALEGLAEALSALPREDKKTKAFAEDVAKTQKAVTEYNKSPSAENLLALYNDWYAAYPPMRKTLHLEMDAFVKPLENALKQSSDSGWLEEYSKLPLLPGQYRNEKGGRLKNIGETLFGKLKKLITSAESPESRMERLAAVENALPKGTKGCLTEEQLNALKKALAEEWRVMVVQAPDYDDELWTLSVDTRKLAPGGTVRVNHDCEASWNWLNQDNFQEKHEIRFTRGGYYSLPNEQRIPEAVKKAVLTVARERNDKILAALDTVFAFDVKDTVVDGDGSTFVQHGKRHYEIPFPFSCAGISKPEWPVPDQIVKDVLGGASFQWFQSWEANGSLKNDTLTQRLSELQSRAFGTDEQDQKKLLEYTLVVLGWSGQSAEIAKYQAYLPALRFQLYAEIGSKLDRVVYKQVPKEKLKEWQDVLTKLAQSKRYNLFNPRQEGLFQKFLGQQL
ncbi:MAG: hypothetical protein K9N51_05750, partial [Candidatus Pacebacteria bacterium]|nr:hypothetical protein [Candidatus Paceibacterota bacterium]